MLVRLDKRMGVVSSKKLLDILSPFHESGMRAVAVELSYTPESRRGVPRCTGALWLSKDCEGVGLIRVVFKYKSAYGRERQTSRRFCVNCFREFALRNLNKRIEYLNSQKLLVDKCLDKVWSTLSRYPDVTADMTLKFLDKVRERR